MRRQSSEPYDGVVRITIPDFGKKKSYFATDCSVDFKFRISYAPQPLGPREWSMRAFSGCGSREKYGRALVYAFNFAQFPDKASCL